MLYQKKRSSNQNGSVLLAVVLVSMMLICLATICLHVVNFTAKSTSKNVQRTQAKVTAEAALQEFMDWYDAQWPTWNSAQATPYPASEFATKRYERLHDLAQGHTATSPLVYKLQMSGESDADFAQQFGATELHIYTETGGTFKVEAITTFSTQTQTASITFGANTTSVSIPTNTFETKKGNTTSRNQLSLNVDGTMYVENTGGANNGPVAPFWRKMSRAIYNAHILVHNYNIIIDDQTFVTDVYNKSVDNNYEHPSSRYFHQAPTLTVNGYVSSQNRFYMGTTVGKTDINRVNSETGAYDPSNLGGYDGYFCTYKKIIAWRQGVWRFGSDANGHIDTSTMGPIDVFCRGYFDGDAYFGITAAQSTIMNCGNYCVRTDADIARNAYNGSDPDITSQMGDQHDKFIVNGDMHCYRQGTEAETNGDMVFAIGNKAPGQFSDSVKVYGDLYIDGDIIFLGTGAAPTGAQPVVNVSGTIHMDGARKIIWKDISTGTEYELPHANGAGLVKAGSGWDTVIPNADGRHHMPEQGYLPLTGYVTDNDTHAYLARSYEGASSNDIFTASCSDCDASIMGNYASYLASNDPNALTASKAIGHKFADAMCTPLSTGSYVDPSDGVTKRACQDYFDLDNNTTVKQINCSVKLTPQEASYWINNNPNVYIVNLTHEDIVIALPLDVGGSNVGKLGASFKILNKARDYGEHHYVYFMWYDQNDESNCLYLNNSSIDASYGTVHRLPAGGTSMDIAGTQPGKTYHATFSPMSPGGFTTDSNGNLIELAQPGTRRGITIEFGDNAQNQNRYLVSDYLLTLPNGAELSDADLTNEDRIKESLKASINYRDVDVPGTGNVPARVVGNPPAPNSNIDNVIMYLVPDYVAVKCDGTTGYQQKVQGVLYAWNSQFAISYSTGSVWYGQLKCDRILYDQDATDFQWLRDIPMGEQSLMSYAGRNGGGGTSSNGYEIRYYNY